MTNTQALTNSLHVAGSRLVLLIVISSMIGCDEGEEPFGSEGATSSECLDGIDNDRNGRTDCEDLGCLQWSFCGGPGEGDGDVDGDVDGDGDGDVDGDGDGDGDDPPDGDVECPGGCDDGLDCTTDRCTPEGCTRTPEDSRCDDGLSCTVDWCSPGVGCQHQGPDLDGDGSVDADCGGTDCDDDDEEVAPGRPEVCDEIDQDCDGVVNDGLCCLAADAESRLTWSESLAAKADVATLVDLIGLVWEDDRGSGQQQVYFRTMTRASHTLGEELQLSDGLETSTTAHIAASSDGARFGVTWNQWRDGELQVFFAILGSEGFIVAPSQVTSGGDSLTTLDVVWTGSVWAILVHSQNHEVLRVALLSAEGALLEDLEVVSGSSPNVDGVLAASATGEVAVVWSDASAGPSRILVSFWTADFAAGSTPLAVSSSTDEARDVAATWQDEELGIAWTDWRDGNAEVYFNALRSRVVACPLDLRVTASDDSSIAAALLGGDRYTVACRDRREGRNTITVGAIDSASCTLSSEAIEVIWGDPNDPELSHGADGPLIVWTDARAAPISEIYGTTVNCTPLAE